MGCSALRELQLQIIFDGYNLGNGAVLVSVCAGSDGYQTVSMSPSSAALGYVWWQEVAVAGVLPELHTQTTDELLMMC